MEYPQSTLRPSPGVLGYAIPSVVIISSAVAVYFYFGSDAPARVPWLFLVAPFVSSVSIAGIRPTFRSQLPLWSRLLLVLLHLVAVFLAFSPIISLVVMLILIGGPINPG